MSSAKVNAAQKATQQKPSQRMDKFDTTRIKNVDWDRVYKDLDAQGNAVIKQILLADECRNLISIYSDEERFRKRIVMASHGYGRGEYKYFNYPLPGMVENLRTAVYPRLVELANRWNEIMKIPIRYPEQHAEFLERCHNAGQVRPTPLILKYGPDDFNCLHQDLYGEHVFPLQLAILLAKPQVGSDDTSGDFTGGEFIMTEQRPRMQTTPMVVHLNQGDGVIFAVHNRPVKGTKGYYRVNMRHGVSKLLSGSRHTLGVIFHDAK